MLRQSFTQPVAVNLSSPLAIPSCRVSQPTRRWALLAALVLLCLAPRAVMAWKLQAVCPDGVHYIHQAQLIEAGHADEAFRYVRPNLLPFLLVPLHQAGLDWEPAGKLLGVVMASLVVLPLYGWARRRFNDRVALAACLLYAVHGELIRWSPEILRDPTFWFLFTLDLYLMWRAVTEARSAFFLAAGLVLALATLTRFEGYFLLIPLAVWTLGKLIARRGVSSPRERLVPRLLIGIVLCLGPWRLLLAGAGMVAPVDHATAEPRTIEPEQLLQPVAQSLLPSAMEQSSTATDGAIPILPGASPGQLMVIYLTTVGKGISLPFFWLGGLAIWRRRSLQAALPLDSLAILLTTLVLLAAIAVHLYAGGTTSTRYIFPAVLMLAPLAGAGLLEVVGGLRRLGTARQWARLPRVAILLVPALVITLPADFVLAADVSQRAAKAELGRWARARFGPSLGIVGPWGLTEVVNHYAGGHSESFPADAQDDLILSPILRSRPDMVLLPSARAKGEPGRALVQRIEACGLAEVDPAELPPGCGRVVVLVRSVEKMVDGNVGNRNLEDGKIPNQDKKTQGTEARALQWIAAYCSS
jgi:hypothetical protein